MDSAVALGRVDLSCGMGMDLPEESNDETSFHGAPCCENEFVSIEIDDEFNSAVEKNGLNVNFVLAFVHSSLIPATSEYSVPGFQDISPLLIEQDFQVLYQHFLI